MHLATSMRSFRAESLSRFVKALLDGAPHPIDIRVNIDPVHWFLSPAKDTRSTLYRTPSSHSFRGAPKMKTAGRT